MCHDLLGYMLMVMMMMPGVCALFLMLQIQDGACGLSETCGLCMWGGWEEGRRGASLFRS